MKTILLLVFLLNISNTRPDLREKEVELKTNSVVMKYKLGDLMTSDLSKTLQNIDLLLGRSSDWGKLEDSQDFGHRGKRSPKKKKGKKSSKEKKDKKKKCKKNKKSKKSKKSKEKKSKESSSSEEDSSEEDSCQSNSEETTT